MSGSRGWWSRVVAFSLFVGIPGGPGTRDAAAQLAQSGQMVIAPRNAVTAELSPLAASIGYARSLSGGGSAGVALGAGAQAGFMGFADDFTIGGYGADRVFVQLLHGDIFLRSRPDRLLELEVGARAAWLYHPPTEYETRFIGGQCALLARVGRVRLGPRLIIGHMREESGRSATNIGLLPLVARLQWTW